MIKFIAMVLPKIKQHLITCDDVYLFPNEMEISVMFNSIILS